MKKLIVAFFIAMISTYALADEPVQFNINVPKGQDFVMIVASHPDKVPACANCTKLLTTEKDVTVTIHYEKTDVKVESDE